MNDTTFRAMLVEAISDLAQPGASIEAVLGDFEPPKSVAAARAFGFLEGAAAALDVTVLELLDEFGLL